MKSASYDLLAEEYYDPRHRTCRNFDCATAAAIAASPPEIPAGLVLEVGCGRGRCGEFLGLPPNRVVQLDSSARMLSLQPREECLLKVHASATEVPLHSQQFSAVVGFLVDPFMGLNFLREAYRLLRPGGKLFLTTPAYAWGVALRGQENPRASEARFVSRQYETVCVPSVLYPDGRLRTMLDHSGFGAPSILHSPLPANAGPISADIERAAEAAKVVLDTLPILTTIQAGRPS
jgi:SAM-dependent methyltransferase